MTALRKGLLKMMSKMGIATIQSYCGAQIFEAVGLDRDLVDRYFGGTPSAVGGVGLDELAREALERHARAYPERHGRSLPEHVEDSQLPAAHASLLPQGGVYAWRLDGERHAWDPADDRRAAARRRQERARRSDEPASATRSSPSASTSRTAPWRCSAACSSCAPPATRSRSTRSSRRPTSSSASRPAA